MPRRKGSRLRAERKFAHRTRTSSQSSVEIQVTERDSADSTTTTTSVTIATMGATPMPQLVSIAPEFKELVKTVGARGYDTPRGELFTVKELINHLGKYISERGLFDPTNPAKISCSDDPLKHVLGVESFTIPDTRDLVNSKVTPVTFEPRPLVERSGTSIPPPLRPQISIMDALMKRGGIPNSPVTSRVLSPGAPSPGGNTNAPEADPSVSSTTITPKLEQLPQVTARDDVTDDEMIPPTQAPARTSPARASLFSDVIPPTQPSSHPRCSAGSPRERLYHSKASEENPEVKVKDENAKVESVGSSEPQPSTSNHDNQNQRQHTVSGRTNAKRKRKRKREPSGDSSVEDEADCGPPARKRGSSLSITCQEVTCEDESQDGGESWQLTMLKWQGSGDESDESVLSIQSKETVVVKDSEDDLWFMDEEENMEIRLSIGTLDNESNFHHHEEYEPHSDTDSYYGNQVTEEDDSDSPYEPIFVVLSDRDMEFWADSESSDSEDSTDEDLKPDMWECDKCRRKTPPTRSKCDYCPNRRSGWFKSKGNNHDVTCVNRDGRTFEYITDQNASRTNSDNNVQTSDRKADSPDFQRPGCSYTPYRGHPAACTALRTGPVPMSPNRPVCVLSPYRHSPSARGTPPRSPRRRLPSLGKPSPRKRLPSEGRAIREADQDVLILPRSPLPVDVAFPFGPKPMNPGRSILSPLRACPTRGRSFSCSDALKVPPPISPLAGVAPNVRGHREVTPGSPAIKHLTFSERPGTSIDATHWTDSHAEDPGCDEADGADDVFCDVSGKSSFTSLASTPCEGESLLGRGRRPSDTSGTGSQSDVIADRKLTSQTMSSDSFTFSSQDSAIDVTRTPVVTFNDAAKVTSQPSPSDIRPGGKNSPRKKPGLTLPAIASLSHHVPVPGSPRKRTASGTEYSDLCHICFSKPKEASIVHGKTGHQVCCYTCAKRLRRKGKPCPVCRRPIQKVIKNYLT